MGVSEEPARTTQGWLWTRYWALFRQQLDDPLLRNGYMLMMNTAATGLLGLLYWVLVARLYAPVDVGRASAAYVAMNLLAGIASLSFQGTVTRFIPQAGRWTGLLIGRAYGVSVAGSVLMTLVFLVVAGHLGPSYTELGSLTAAVVFVVCVAAWVLFTLQDSVLTGLRGASWVLAENGAFGVVKIGLLVALAAALPHLGIYISWMLPAIVAVPLVNSLIFGRLVPRHSQLTSGSRPPTARQIGRFLAGDYTGALAVLASTNLVPVVVAARVDPRSDAYFFMAWAVGGVMELLAVNMATSLTVEGAFDASTLAENARSALRRMAMILVPCVLAATLLGRWGLGLFGPGYASRGAPVLAFIALGTLPQGAVELYLGVLRAQSRAGLLAIVQGVRAVLLLALSLAMVIRLGTVGVGLAFLASQTVVAGLIVPGLWRVLRPAGGRAAAPPHPVPAAGLRPSPAVAAAVTMPMLRITPDLIPLGTVMMRATAAGTVASRRMAEAETMPMPKVAPARPAPPRRPRLRLPPWLPVTPTTAAVGALAAAGLAMFFWSLRGMDLNQMNGLGLISVLPPVSLAGVVLLSGALLAGITLPRAHPVLLGSILAALVICLDGVTAVAEAQPRFPTAYQIAGFVDYVAKHGYAAPGLQAYFSWPSFFAFFAFLGGATGEHSLLTVLRLWPVTIDLLCLLPLFMIMRNLRMSWRARWLAGFFFTVGNWVGQDYFSPQAFNYLMYLVVVAILVTWFTGTPAGRPAGAGGGNRWLRWPASWPGSGLAARLRSSPAARPPGRLRWLGVLSPARLHRRIFGTLEPGEQPAREISKGQRAFLLALLIGIYAVAITSHQLSPFYIFGACAVLVLVRRCTLPGLPILLAIMESGWVTFATIAYWSGHRSNVFGGLGNFIGNLLVSTGGRTVGSTPIHAMALQTRELVAAAIMLLAIMGILRRRLRHLDDRILIVLLFMPVPSIGLQSYGGEMVLRIYLFMLPIGAILAACFFFPGPQASRFSWRWVPALAVCAAIFPLAFLTARYGNDSFERTPTGELTAINYIYAHAPHGAQVLWLSPAPATDVTPQMPWSYQDIAKVSFAPEKAPANPADTAGLVSALRQSGPGSYLVIPQTQMTYLEEADGYRSDYGQQIRAFLAATPGVQVAYSNPTTVIYTVRYPPGATAHVPAVNPNGPAIAPSIWTPLGLAVFWLGLVILLVREFTRVYAPAAARLLRPLTMAAWPLVIFTAGIVIIRFVVL